MQVNRVATMQIETARPDEPVFEVAQKMKLGEIGIVPVVERGKVIGVLTDRDIVTRVVAERMDPDVVLARDVMTQRVHWIFEDAELEHASRLMATEGIRRLVVLDHQHEPVGILSIDDMAIFSEGRDTVGRVLERIVENTSVTADFKRTAEAYR